MYIPRVEAHAMEVMGDLPGHAPPGALFLARAFLWIAGAFRLAASGVTIAVVRSAAGPRPLDEVASR
jgi:hypothetical protein